MTNIDIESPFSNRTAIEALRNGVPNGKAVDILGSNQPIAEAKFQDLLDSNVSDEHWIDNSRSLVISGDFGTGKSHLLEYFKHLALSQNFICSMISVSKETPFNKLGSVFKAAIDEGVVPSNVGQMINEITILLDFNSQEYARFFQWANNQSEDDLHQIFPASLIVNEKSPDLEVTSKMRNFWSGEKLLQSDIRSGLNLIGQERNYKFRAPRQRDLEPQRLRFVLELIKAAGYKGWVILIDEFETIASYSILQRAQSYAELARWLGMVPGEIYPGLITVASITDDYELSILNEKGDRDNVGPRFQNRDEPQNAAKATAGMLAISERMVLEEIDEATIDRTLEKIRQLYEKAYGWDASPFKSNSQMSAGYQRRMRYKIRSAISQWDLQRLFPEVAPDIVAEEFKLDYEEDKDLESGEHSTDT